LGFHDSVNFVVRANTDMVNFWCAVVAATQRVTEMRPAGHEDAWGDRPLASGRRLKQKGRKG
jgi:hypothetical protein